MAVPTIVQSNANRNLTRPSAGNHTVPMPTSITDGNLLIAFLVVDDEAPTTSITFTGWTEIWTDFGFSNGSMRVAAYWRTASSEPSSYTWDTQDADTEPASSIVLEVSGHNGVGASGTSRDDSVSGTSTITCPSITVTSADSLILRMYSADTDTISSVTATELQNNAGGVGYVASALGYEDGPASGGTGTSTASIAGDQWASATVEILTAAASTPIHFRRHVGFSYG